MTSKKGISLIGLIIMIIIVVIIAALIIPQMQEKTNQANIAKHNINISTIQEEVIAYYNSHDSTLPALKDGASHDRTYPISANGTLYAEISKNGEANDIFYIVDMKKIYKTSGDTGEDMMSDDVYIVSSVKHSIYYAKGIKIKEVTYHARVGNNSGVIAGVPVTPVPVLGDGSFDGVCNGPRLAAGMTPVKYDASFGIWRDLTDEEKKNANHEWYDYRNTGTTANKWANVRLADGSMLVWIPRYTYHISAGEEHTATAGTIFIKFSNGITDDTTGNYHIHPAFYWGGWDIPASADMVRQAGGIEIRGIWVGKFEVSAANGEQGSGGDRIAILPNVPSWRTVKIGDAFDKCIKMQTLNSLTYGIDNNVSAIIPHMLKNSEWGAAAYLSKYARGINEVGLNDDTDYVGGKGNYALYTGLSTTGNEYGIYDMSGETWEFVACYINNGNSNLNNFGSAIVNANTKYKDVFPISGTDTMVNNYNLTDKAYGYAFWETSATGSGSTGWFADYTRFMETFLPFTLRGGRYESGSDAGVFSFERDDGGGYAYISWRVGVVAP